MLENSSQSLISPKNSFVFIFLFFSEIEYLLLYALKLDNRYSIFKVLEIFTNANAYTLSQDTHTHTHTPTHKIICHDGATTQLN